MRLRLTKEENDHVKYSDCFSEHYLNKMIKSQTGTDRPHMNCGDGRHCGSCICGKLSGISLLTSIRLNDIIEKIRVHKYYDRCAGTLIAFGLYLGAKCGHDECYGDTLMQRKIALEKIKDLRKYVEKTTSFIDIELEV